MAQDEALCNVKAAIEENRCDDCLDRIGQECSALAPAVSIFSPSKIEVAAKFQLPCTRIQMSRANQLCFRLR